MLIDGEDEHVVEPNGTATDNLAIINPDGLNGEQDVPSLPVASDCM